MVVDYEVVEAMVMEMGECGVQHTMFPYAREDHVNMKNDEVVVNLACKLNTHVDVDELESSSRVQTTTPEINNNQMLIFSFGFSCLAIWKG